MSKNLKQFTQARIGLGRAGHSTPTSAHLEFQMAHALARDAVHLDWNLDSFKKKLGKLTSITIETKVKDRNEYLKRPDLGRSIQVSDIARLKRISKADIAIIISNGLSTKSIENHAMPLLKNLLLALKKEKFKIAPLVLTKNARVGASDAIGLALKAKLSIIIIGERPGLTAEDSLAIYLTYNPKKGNTDAQRNCISNIRPPEGLNYKIAVDKTIYLVKEALRLQLSGVNLKEDQEPLLTGVNRVIR